MIADWFIDLGQGFVSWFFGLFPSDWEVPDWLTSMMTNLTTVVNNGVNVGVWVPWAVIFAVVGAILLFWVLGFTIKGLRWLLGLLPTMGGGS